MYNGLSVELKELAKTNVRAAMKKEMGINQGIIDSIGVLHRNSARYKKEAVFYAMARNDAMRYFLNLDETELNEWKKPSTNNYEGSAKTSEMSSDYQNLMYRISSTSYAPNIRRTAERRLFYDYTHADHKRRRYLLDEELPERSKASVRWERFLDLSGNIIGYSFGAAFWVGLITLLIYVAFSDDDSSTKTSSSTSSSRHSTSSGNGNTFGSGGVSGGNSSSKSVSDSSQVKDGSGQAGFGNGGKSGHDAPSSVSSSSTNSSSASSSAGVSKSSNANSKNNIASGSDEKKPVNSLDITYDFFVAEYSLPDYAPFEIFEINNGHTTSVVKRQNIKMRFRLPSNSGAIYKLNEKEIKPLVPSNIKDIVTLVQFIPEDGENIITVEYRNSTSRYTFQINSNECFRNKCVLQ